MAPRKSARAATQANTKAKRADTDTIQNKRSMKAATGAGRGRPKKTATADTKPSPAKQVPSKRKAQAKEAPASKKPANKALARPKKVIINSLRHTVGLQLYVFGEGSGGELGLGASSKAIDVKRPRLNLTLTDMNIVQVATGGMHNAALTSDNRIVTWGVNDSGALGRDTTYEDVKMKDIEDANSDSDSDADSDGGLNPLEATPTTVPMDHLPEGTTFVDVVAGDSCTFALTDEGLVYGWGNFRKNEGVLGFTKEVETARTPVLIKGLSKITAIACGANHALALDIHNKVWAWGSGQQNQLGRRITERHLLESLTPTQVGFSVAGIKPRPSKKIVKIACGDYHSFAMGEDGYVWSWGVNNYGETGHPENAGTDNATIPNAKVITSLNDYNLQSITGGTHHNIALTDDGKVLAWGKCDGAQLGMSVDSLDDEDVIKDENDKPRILIKPTAVSGLDNIAMATCGSEHSIVINKTGQAYSWGFGATFQLGLGSVEDVETPTLIENTAVKEQKLVWAGCGGQFSILASAKQ